MSYSKQIWANGSGGGTPVSAARLQYIEDGLEVAAAAADIHGATGKTTPVDADELALIDSAASNVLKKLTWADVKTALAAWLTTLTATWSNKTLTSPILTTPALNGIPTGTGVAAAATADTLALRDSNANLTADAFVPGRTSTATAAGTTTLTIADTQIQVFTGSTTQTVKLPTTGVTAGLPYTIINQSSGAVTVQSSGGNSILSVGGGRAARFAARFDTPTGSADWAVMSVVASATAQTNTSALRDASGNLLATAFVPSLASTATAAGTTTLTVSSAQVQVFTGSTTQTVTLPTTTVAGGQSWKIINTSSGAVTINSSGANLVKTLAAGAVTEVTALQATPTTAAHWYAS